MIKTLEEKFNKALQISDGDLDGGGAITLSKTLFPDMDYIVPKERSMINQEVEKAINSGKYSTIIMTDCSPSDDSTIELINKFVEEGNEFVLLDHHKTALGLNKYSWSRVKVETDGLKHCGTELLYRYYEELGIDVKHLEEFAELVRSYDTWDWSINRYKKPEDLNKFYYYLELDAFIEDISFKLNNSLDLLDEKDYIALSVIELMDNRYIESKKDKFNVVDYNGMNVAVLFTDRCVSKLGNIICQENPEIDFCCLVDLNRDKCSMRTIKDEIRLSEIAKKYGGGGHDEASGFIMSPEVKQYLLNNIF